MKISKLQMQSSDNHDTRSDNGQAGGNALPSVHTEPSQIQLYEDALSVRSFHTLIINAIFYPKDILFFLNELKASCYVRAQGLPFFALIFCDKQQHLRIKDDYAGLEGILKSVI